MIADKLALERKIDEAERIEFWEAFEERFGPVGADPVGYYSFEVGHILHVLPDQVAELTPSDLMGAVSVFDALYRAN